MKNIILAFLMLFSFIAKAQNDYNIEYCGVSHGGEDFETYTLLNGVVLKCNNYSGVKLSFTASDMTNNLNIILKPFGNLNSKNANNYAFEFDNGIELKLKDTTVIVKEIFEEIMTCGMGNYTAPINKLDVMLHQNIKYLKVYNNTHKRTDKYRVNKNNILKFKSSIACAAQCIKAIDRRPPDPNPITDVLTMVEQMPEYVGGNDSLFKFIENNIIYPSKEKENYISGRCYVTFVIDRDGYVRDAKILRGIKGGDGLSTEALRIINKMPKWIPGKQNGKIVNVQFNMPITFTL